MRAKTFALLAAILSIIATTGVAEARRAKVYHGTGYRHASVESSYRKPRAHRAVHRSVKRSSYAHAHARGAGFVGRRVQSAHVSGPYNAGPRPAKWCGWYMRTQLGGGPEYNLAANWRNYGRPTSPQVGAVVVWPHHVGIITGQSGNGKWIVRSGNYSGGVREVPMNVRGAQFRI